MKDLLQIVKTAFNERNSLFENTLISDSKINLLLKISRFVRFDKRHYIPEEAPDNNIYFVLTGIFSHCVKSPDLKEKILKFSFPGDILYPYSSLNADVRIEAVCDCTTLKIKQDEFVSIFFKDNNSLRIIVEERYMSKLVQEIYFSRLDPVEQYDFIIKNSKALLKMPQKYIASYMGITPQTLCKIRKRILRAGTK